MKHTLRLCMVCAMLLVLCTLMGCKGKQGKEVEVDLSSNPTSVSESAPTESTADKTEVVSGSNGTTSSQAEATDTNGTTDTNVNSSEGSVIVGEDVVIDMGEELF